MAQKKIENEIESWMEDVPDEFQEAFLELIEVDGESISMTIGEEELAFTISYPKEYPNGGNFSVFSEESSLFQWIQMINEFAERMPKLKIGQLLEEMAERYMKLSGGGEDDEMEGMDLRQSQGGFDSVVGSALAKEAKKRVQELEKVAKGNQRAVGFVDYDESNSIIRAALSVSFLDAVTAKVWGLNKDMPIIVELKFHLEDMSKPPAFSLYQSSDSNLAGFKLKDVHSFGLEWQLRARLDDWLNGGKESKQKPNWPPKEGVDFIGNVLDHILERVNTCTKTCIICDGPLPFQMIKPAVCDRNLCVHSHEQYGLGADVASELRDNPPVVDLLISFCYAISQGDHRRFNPYPIGVEAKVLDSSTPGVKREVTKHFMAENDEKTKNLAAVKRVLDLLPPVTELAKKTDSKSLAAHLDTLDPLCFPLLRWVITSNRAHLAKLEKDDMIQEANTEFQYMFLSSPPEKEAKFQELKKSKGSFWAFHGSAFANWHSILRIGLKNYSNTELMSCGAAYGAGIYLSPFSSTSMGYAHAMTGWQNSTFKGTGNLTCLCICEVIDDGYKANPHYVVPNEDHVMTRYFLIYNSQYTCPSLEANKLKGLKSSPLANTLDKKGSGGILKKILG